jgi:AcrR family transcriptional regulator
MDNNESNKSKKFLILETAKQIFAEKGFDGARMDEIANRAGVKKSLIYYHFEGKDQLLQEILNMFFEDFGSLLRSKTMDESSTKNKYMDFLDKNSDLLRVIIIESLKKNTKLPSIFKAVEMLMDYEKEIEGKLDPAQYPSDHKRWVAEFFTSILPSIGFVCYKDAWCNYFSIDTVTFEKDFLESYSETHGEYHKRRNMSRQDKGQSE